MGKPLFIINSELIKDGVVKVDVSSIGTKFENFVQAGCRDLGLHRSRNVYCRKPIILPNLVLFFQNVFRITSTPFHYLWVKYQKFPIIYRSSAGNHIFANPELFLEQMNGLICNPMSVLTNGNIQLLILTLRKIPRSKHLPPSRVPMAKVDQMPRFLLKKICEIRIIVLVFVQKIKWKKK